MLVCGEPFIFCAVTARHTHFFPPIHIDSYTLLHQLQNAERSEDTGSGRDGCLYLPLPPYARTRTREHGPQV